MTKINFEIPALLLSCKSLDFLVYKINCTNLVQTAPPPHNLVAIHVFTNLLLWVEISQKAFFALDDFYWNSKGQFMACIASDKKITLSATSSCGSDTRNSDFRNKNIVFVICIWWFFKSGECRWCWKIMKNNQIWQMTKFLVRLFVVYPFLGSISGTRKPNFRVLKPITTS